MARKRKKKSGRIVLATVLTVLLIAAIGLALAVTLRQLQVQREARNAGVQKYSREIPRNVYGMEGFSAEDGRVAYGDEHHETVMGVDVSVHQGVIDWQAAAADGVRFAIVQAGYRGYSDGDLGEDEQFRANLSGAKAAGIETGVYFFSQATSEEEAREEAAFVLELLADEPLDRPVFYDWERIGSAPARTDETTGETVTACAKAFCETIEAGGYEAGIYFNQNDIYTFVDLAQLLDYPLWMAQYQNVPDFFYDFDYWQYTDSGTVAGIEGPVDLDVFFAEKTGSQ